MSDHIAHDPTPKGVAEHGVCFGVAAGGMVMVAIILQWLLRFTL